MPHTEEPLLSDLNIARRSVPNFVPCCVQSCAYTADHSVLAGDFREQ
jgi:hypothetical protein